MESNLTDIDLETFLLSQAEYFGRGVFRQLIEELKSERKKTKLWDEAPEEAVSIMYSYCDKDGFTLKVGNKNRERSKTEARKIAEKYGYEHCAGASESFIELIEKACNEAIESKK